jgi:HAD superfamily hydrolase (TIGR01549 family)
MKTIIFDLWGTLLHNPESLFIHDILDAFGKERTPENYALIEESMMRSEFADKEEMYYVLAKTFDSSLTKELNRELDKIFKRRNESVIFDDVDFLRQLKGRYRLILLSNTCSLDGVREFKKLEPYFDDIILSCDIGHLKPEKEAFKFVLDKHGLDPKDVIMVGDSKRIDLASEKVGIRAIIVDRFNKFDDIETVKDLYSIKKYLR